jgi:hypothetical protein
VSGHTVAWMVHSGSVSALGESNPSLIPGSVKDAFAGEIMPLEPSDVSAGSLCHVQQSAVAKQDSLFDGDGSSVPLSPKLICGVRR